MAQNNGGLSEMVSAESVFGIGQPPHTVAKSPSAPRQDIPPTMDNGRYILDENKDFGYTDVYLGYHNPNNELTITENHKMSAKNFYVGFNKDSCNNHAYINSGATIFLDFQFQIGAKGSENSVDFKSGSNCFTHQLIIGPGAGSANDPVRKGNNIHVNGIGATCRVTSRLEVSGEQSRLHISQGARLQTDSNANVFIGGETGSKNTVSIHQGIWNSDSNIHIYGGHKNAIRVFQEGRLNLAKSLYFDGSQNYALICLDGEVCIKEDLYLGGRGYNFIDLGHEMRHGKGKLIVSKTVGFHAPSCFIRAVNGSLVEIGNVLFNSNDSDIIAGSGGGESNNYVTIKGKITYDSASNSNITMDSNAIVRIENTLTPPTPGNYFRFGAGFLFLKGNQVSTFTEVIRSKNVKIWKNSQWEIADTSDISMSYDSRNDGTIITGGQKRITPPIDKLDIEVLPITTKA